MRASDEPSAESERPQWPSRLALALGVTLAQVLVGALVFGLFMLLTANAASESPDDWAGLEYLIIGVAATPIAAAITGPIAAARLRLPLYGLYALPVLLGFLAFITPFFPSTFDFHLPGLPVYLGGNVLVAAATARLPRRPRTPRTGTGGVPF